MMETKLIKEISNELWSYYAARLLNTGISIPYATFKELHKKQIKELSWCSVEELQDILIKSRAAWRL